MSSSQNQVVLGFKKQDWLLLLGDAVFVYFMLLWPALKTLVVIHLKRFIGRLSLYWIGLPPLIAVFKNVVFPIK